MIFSDIQYYFGVLVKKKKSILVDVILKFGYKKYDFIVIVIEIY